MKKVYLPQYVEYREPEDSQPTDPTPKYQQLMRQNSARQRARATQLQAKIPPGQEPPCQSCMDSPCCKNFIVPITKDEYESGIYSEYAVEITEGQLREVLKSRVLLSMYVRAGAYRAGYFLEGRPGEPCPYLVNNKCSIYDKRPVTCRKYSCVNDDRCNPTLRDDNGDND